jgi:serine/threonine protein kinase
LKIFVDPAVQISNVLTEARLQRRLSENPHVVSIRNVVIAPPRPLVVMDFLPSGSVEARQPVDFVRAVRWTREALQGLAHAHELGVIHRDVKPGNLLLGPNEEAQLSDFGIAEDTISTFAQSSIYLPHIAPEVAQGGPSSFQTDVWAMGCTLYRLLTDEYPFGDPPDIPAVLSGTFEAPHRLKPQIPMKVTRVVQEALEPDPAQRFPSAREMHAALNECAAAVSWQPVIPTDALEEWTADSAFGVYTVRIQHRPRAGDYQVIAKLDQGSGPRQVRSETCDRLSDAERHRRNFLTTVAEGNKIERS